MPLGRVGEEAVRLVAQHRVQITWKRLGEAGARTHRVIDIAHHLQSGTSDVSTTRTGGTLEADTCTHNERATMGRANEEGCVV